MKRNPIKTELLIEEIQDSDLNPRVRILRPKRDGCVSGGGSSKAKGGKGRKGGKGWTVDWGKNNKWSIPTPNNTGGVGIRGDASRKNSKTGA